jgi:hypothetical protein
LFQTWVKSAAGITRTKRRLHPPILSNLTIHVQQFRRNECPAFIDSGIAAVDAAAEPNQQNSFNGKPKASAGRLSNVSGWWRAVRTQSPSACR